MLVLATGLPAAAQGVRKTADEFNKMSRGDTSLVELHGVVSRLRSNPRGVFWLKDATGEAYIYGLVDGRPGSDVSFVQMQVVVGDTLTVVGRHTVYNGTTIEMAGGHLVRKANGPRHAEEWAGRLLRLGHGPSEVPERRQGRPHRRNGPGQVRDRHERRRAGSGGGEGRIPVPGR